MSILPARITPNHAKHVPRGTKPPLRLLWIARSKAWLKPHTVLLIAVRQPKWTISFRAEQLLASTSPLVGAGHAQAFFVPGPGRP